MTGAESPAALAAMADDLKSECQEHEEDSTRDGWTKDRFQQCFVGQRTIHLMPRNGGIPVATIEVEFSLLAFAYDGQRRVDYVFSFDGFDVKGGEPLPVTTLTVNFGGCGARTACAPASPSRSEFVPVWLGAPNRTYQFSVTSPDDVGAGAFKIERSFIQMDMTVFTPVPNVLPWQESAMASSRARFDSAREALGSGKYHGTVFTDFVPTVEFDLRQGSPHRSEARHIDDALHAPQRTFPSFPGKSVPGEAARPLHRLMDQRLADRNHDAAVAVCRDVWGLTYPDGNLECDEYPFRSTHEGAYVSTGGGSGRWNGSARPIDGDENRRGGTHLGNFYGMNRVLDENAGTDDAGKPSDPFRVRVIN
ncbi:MAG TPA: hypothetical protein VK453_14420 [Micromonosporaceae bacterium]|nr:hypothetical protein [Micromonosporaceae bacterium]